MDVLERLQGIRRDQEIDGWRVRVYFWSRDIWLLAGIAAVILAIAGGLGWFMRTPNSMESLLAGKDGEETGKPRVSLQEELRKPNPDPVRIFQAFDSGPFRFFDPEGEPPEELIKTSKLPDETKQVAVAFLQSTTTEDGLPVADLLFYAHWVKPFRFANELVADLHQRSGDVVKARKYYEREARFHDSSSARRKLVEMLTEERDFAALGSITKEARYREHLSQHASIFLAVHEGRWKDVLQPLGAYELSMWKPVPAILAVVAGIIWMAIALQAIQPSGLFCFRIAVPFLAVGSGMASTWPTLFAGLWEEQVWGLRHTGDFVSDFGYFLAGVGPREEIIKLVFFLPFVPFLLRRGSRLEMLMIAGCVGLGFAIQENLQYFEQAGPVAAFGRFLTANFFHLAATGVIGLSLCDALREPRTKAFSFLVTLAAVTLAHGFYDAFLGMPGIQLFLMFSMIAFLLLALYFFRQLRTLRDGTTDQLSIAATLVIGLATLVGLTFVLAARQLGFEFAGLTLAVNGVGLIMVCYMFYWQLGEGMSAVEEKPRWSYHG